MAPRARRCSVADAGLGQRSVAADLDRSRADGAIPTLGAPRRCERAIGRTHTYESSPVGSRIEVSCGTCEVSHCFEKHVETDLEGVAELVAGLKHVLDGEPDEVGVGVGIHGGRDLLDRADELALGL